MARWREVLITLGFICGIYVCFLSQGVCQESIYRLKDEKTGERFKYPLFLVALVSSISGGVGYMVTRVEASRPNGEASRVVPALRDFIYHRKANDLLKQGFYVSLSYIGAMICTNFALTRVNYPMQVLVKSAKAVPVVVGGYVFFGKRYHYSDYLTVVCVTLSLILFQWGNLMNPKTNAASTWTGFVALLTALLFDGLTGPRQDKMVENYQISTGDLMFIINVCSLPLVWSAAWILEGAAPYGMMSRNSLELVPRLALFVVCGAAGQVCIVRILRQMGSLHLTLITTTRKFLAILISVALYKHPLSPLQWFAVFLLFTSGFFKYLLKERKPSTSVREVEIPLRKASASQPTPPTVAPPTISEDHIKHT
ncbi:galactose transporter [Gregarina niphandrodes]|uniref:Galactose transporter n=1 Tax=Gregarina niphandrodes TaxID=110365 RepID=A0A023BB01_GRENI|nr:galactose transporter [Gregarina niphandrodes]EZG78613.1 galactose transporter [Gregarina niphandrodes]|eukprot:XP_011129240.1 galactose transporter [Gregarina niphandrodes]